VSFLQAVLDDPLFQTGTYTVTRTVAGSYVQGRYVPGGTTTLNVDASVQPITGRDLLALPEGQRTEEMRVVFAKTELRTRGPSNDPDRLTIDGEAWEVRNVERWQGLAETHYRAVVARQVVA
jgi:hypothetical protein